MGRGGVTPSTLRRFAPAALWMSLDTLVEGQRRYVAPSEQHLATPVARMVQSRLYCPPPLPICAARRRLPRTAPIAFLAVGSVCRRVRFRGRRPLKAGGCALQTSSNPRATRYRRCPLTRPASRLHAPSSLAASLRIEASARRRRKCPASDSSPSNNVPRGHRSSAPSRRESRRDLHQ